MVTEWLEEDIIDEKKLCHCCKKKLAKNTIFFLGAFFSRHGWAWLCEDCIKKERSWWNLDIWNGLFTPKTRNHYDTWWDGKNHE